MTHLWKVLSSAEKKKLPVNKDLGLISHNFESPIQKSEKRIQNLTSQFEILRQ